MARDLTGQQVRGYQIQELIGMGGFAAVYRAHQPGIDREVAIKVILPKYANNPDFVRRFESEALLIARLEHLHIVPLYDFWREPDNAFLVMRWLRGGTLYQSVTRRGAWSLADTARLLDQIAAGLTVAHRHGVIHQDLTPANILLDEDNNAYLADFGIAKNLQDPADRPGRGTIFGSPAYMAPEQIAQQQVSAQTDIYSLGIVLFHVLTGRPPFDAASNTTVIRQQVQAPLPPLQSANADLPPALNLVVMRAAAKNPEMRYANALSLAADFRQTLRLLGHESAVRESSGVQSTEADLPSVHTVDLGALAAEPVNPYKGLRAFDEADATHFFGRAMRVQQLCRRVAELPPDRRLLTLVGPSGSGKSSLVRAGVIPALRQGLVQGADRWFYARMLPGAYPMAELETALLGVTFESAGQLADLLRDPAQGLAGAVARILPDDESELVLFIDQFEELFTLVEWEAERRTFLGLLQRAVTDPRSRLRVILTLRADFYDRPLQEAEFGELVRASTEVILPLAEVELREAITGPALREGLMLEEGLPDAIVADLRAQLGALPLLQYALTELFEQRNGRVLTREAYATSGGVAGALARRADEIYRALSARQQAAARQMSLRLVAFGEEGAATRRRVLVGDLLSMPQVERPVMQSVLDTFGRYRLLTFDHDPQTRAPTVEVAHEALLQSWDRLRTWLDESRDSLRAQRQLALAVADWVTAGEDASFLASGARLTQFESLSQAGHVALTEQETTFVASSVRQRQRAIRRRRLLMIALTVITLLALGAAGFAADRQQRAEQARATSVAERDRADAQARIARSRELAITASLVSDQPDLALLLSLEAGRAADTFEARGRLLSALQAQPYLVRMLNDHATAVRCVAFSPDGRWLATGDRAGNIIVWDAVTQQRFATIAPEPIVTVNALAFAPDSQTLAAGAVGGSIWLWDVPTWQPRLPALTGHAGDVWHLAFSPDGQVLVSASADATLRLWDVAAGTPIGVPLVGHEDIVFSAAFSPDGTRLASASADLTVRLWDVATREPLGEPLVGHSNWVMDVVFSPDGAWLASSGADHTIRLWDLGATIAAGPVLDGHSDWVRSLAFADADHLISGSVDRSVRVWELSSGQVQVLTGHTDAVWGVAAAPDQHTLASAGADGAVLLWNWGAETLRQQTLTGQREAIDAVAFSPDGTLVAAGSGEPLGRGQDNTVRLWDVESGALLAELEGHASVVTGVAFAPDSQRLASTSADGTLMLWDVPGRAAAGPPIKATTPLLMALAFSPDGTLLAVGGADGGLVVLDAQTAAPLTEPLYGHEGGILALAFSPDGRWLVSGSEDGTARIWDTRTRTFLPAIVLEHPDQVTSLAFDPTGALLATGCRDASIRLWDTLTWQIDGPPLIGHTRRVTALAFAPDGDLLASGSQDTTLRLWDVALRRALAGPVLAHRDWVTGVGFSAQGLLVSGSWDGQLILWRASSALWQQTACQIANRDLSTDEWARFFPGEPYRRTCEGEDSRSS